MRWTTSPSGQDRVGNEQYLCFGAAKPECRPESNWEFVEMKWKPTNLKVLELYTKEVWSKIPVEMCKISVTNYKNRLTAVIENKGSTVDYWERFQIMDMEHFNNKKTSYNNIFSNNILLRQCLTNFCHFCGSFPTSRYPFTQKKNHFNWPFGLGMNNWRLNFTYRSYFFLLKYQQRPCVCLGHSTSITEEVVSFSLVHHRPEHIDLEDWMQVVEVNTCETRINKYQINAIDASVIIMNIRDQTFQVKMKTNHYVS